MGLCGHKGSHEGTRGNRARSLFELPIKPGNVQSWEELNNTDSHRKHLSPQVEDCIEAAQWSTPSSDPHGLR